MRKLIIGSMFLLTLGLSAMVWRFDDFESGAFGDINVLDLDADGQNWEVAPTVKSKSGGYIARSSSSGLTPDNLMDFPAVYVEAASYFTFWVGAENDAACAETFQVYIDFNGPCQPAISQLILEETLTSAEWKQVEIDLQPYIKAENEWAWDDEVYISIRHSGSSDQSALLIDDVMYMSEPVFFYDEGYSITPEGIFEPFENIESMWSPWDYSGWDEIDGSFIGYKNVRLHYILTDADSTYSEQYVDMVLYPDQFAYPGSFNATLPGMPMGTFAEYWAVVTDNSGFDITGESEHYFLEWGEITYEEGFEDYDSSDGWLPEGWVTYQLGDDQGSSWDRPWEVDVPGQNVNNGNYSITSVSQSNFGVWETENYLVSPRIRINAKDTYLKYFVNAQTIAGEQYRERWSLLISTVDGDGTDVENFTEVKRDSIVPTSDNLDTWYEKVFDLSAYENEQVRIMWKHNYTSTAEKLDRFLNIDDVSISEMPVITVEDPGNAAVPGENFTITATATDYSGINNVTLYYTIDGGTEMSLVMTDNGDNTFTGIIPGQPLDTKCTWYCVVTDGSSYGNTVATDSYEVIWFSDGVLEWGSAGTNYTDMPDPINGTDKVAMDWNFGTKNYLYLNKIEIGWEYAANNISWKLVEFDGVPTDRVIGDLQGVHSFAARGDTLHIEDGKNTPIYGHVGLVFETPIYNEIMLDESGDKSHAWQWNSVSQWTTNFWGAFYIKMYVSQIPNGIENEFVSSTTELCQNYPNPFNPETSISFYNRIAGDVELSVYNVKGEKVASLVNEKMNEGFRKVNFNASGINSGVYYYTLKTPEKTLTKKMVLIK